MIFVRCARVWMRRPALSAGSLLLALWTGLTLPAEAGELRAGVGIARLPLPMNGPLGGYGGWRDRRAQAVLDAPEARALVLEQDGLRVGLVSIDIVIVRPSLRDGLREITEALELDHLVLAATHTHSGPGGYIPGRLPARITSGRFNTGMPRKLVQAALRALELAVLDLSPARAASGLAQLSLARNRRSSSGPHETELPLLRLEFADGRRPAVLFAYGAHPTVLSPKSHAYSADYVGAARTWLEERGWRAIFLPGPLGDQEPASELGPLWSRDLAQQHAQVTEIGGRLGQAVLQGLRGLTPVQAQDAELAVVERWVDAPDPRLRRFCAIWWLAPFTKGSVRSFLSKRAPLHALRIGDARIVALPAEPASAVAQQIRERLAPARPVFVVAHADDWLGYVVSAERYRRGGYEACLSFHGPGLAAWLIEEAGTTARLLESRPLSQLGSKP
jgi:neutral ceramidase